MFFLQRCNNAAKHNVFCTPLGRTKSGKFFGLVGEASAAERPEYVCINSWQEDVKKWILRLVSLKSMALWLSYGYHMPVSTNITMIILITTFPPTHQNQCAVELTCPSQRMRWLPSTQMDAGPTPSSIYSLLAVSTASFLSSPGGGWGGLVPQRIKGLLYQSPNAQNGWNHEGTLLLHRCCSCFCPACLFEAADPFWSLKWQQHHLKWFILHKLS